MPNKITTAGILANAYNSRSLITHNYDNAALVRARSGGLWAAFRENYTSAPINLYYSDDNGFTWDKVWSGDLTTSTGRLVGVGGLNTNGPHITLQLFEGLNRVILWHSYYRTSNGKYNVEPFVFDISDLDNVTRITTDTVTEVVTDADAMVVDAPYNDKTIFVSYIYFSNLQVQQYRPTFQTTAEATRTKTGSYFNVFGTCAHQDGYVDYLLLANTGTGAYKIVHVRYNELSQSFSAETTVEAFAGAYEATDLSIAHDGYGNLCAFWSRKRSTGTDIDVYYSMSSNDGATWTTSTVINKTVGHSNYNDSITGQLAGRTTIMGGIQGFILSYVRDNASNVPKTYVRTLSTSDGSTYTLGDEKEVGTQVAQASDAVVGLRWFQPPAGTLLDLSDPGLVRVAYQIGEGNSATQNDTVPVRICQELLNASAYPSTIDSSSDTYTTDIPAFNEIVVSVNVLGGVSENIDYYAEGLTGSITSRYEAAFNKVGTTTRLFKYEPIVSSRMDDRSAYDAPVEYTSLITFDPGSYEAPLADRGNDGFTTYIERDIRKIYLPPDFHLDRTFIVNAGNFLKRTVWTVYFDGNEYEISQVVPYFIKQQIAYYSANAYVIGPSNDPFGKRVLPSET